MRPIVDLNVLIDRYENSRPDATDASSGADERISCSRSGVIPWSSLDFISATEACAASGKRLCTPAEWRAACGGVAQRQYPYGGRYNDRRCNGFDYEEADEEIATASLADCVTPEGVADLSGNLAEWTSENQLGVGVAGGSYRSGSQDLTCETRQEFEPALIRNVNGFRCCQDMP
jgi:formylglycine-generating enzyme required for sulfatase activity